MSISKITAMIPRRKSPSQYAKSFLFQEFNDIDFFIEDTDIATKRIFTKLLQRSLNETIKLAQIFPLGGRQNVIDKAKISKTKSTRKQIFIIDGDLYLLTGEKVEEENLVELPKYCIENYLIDKNAIENIIIDENEKEIDDMDLKKLFNFDEWKKRNSPLLINLFIEYGIEKKNKLGIQTVAYKVGNLISEPNGDLNKEKVEERIQKFEEDLITKLDNEIYEEEKKEVTLRLKEFDDPLSCISGKDYILPLLLFKIRSLTSSKTPNDKLKFRLARACEIDEFQKLINEKLA